MPKRRNSIEQTISEAEELLDIRAYWGGGVDTSSKKRRKFEEKEKGEVKKEKKQAGKTKVTEKNKKTKKAKAEPGNTVTDAQQLLICAQQYSH